MRSDLRSTTSSASEEMSRSRAIGCAKEWSVPSSAYTVTARRSRSNSPICPAGQMLSRSLPISLSRQDRHMAEAHLPGSQKAWVEEKKIREYLLNLSHDVGESKAR